MSPVMCQMSPVMCQTAPVTFCMFFLNIYFLRNKKLGKKKIKKNKLYEISHLVFIQCNEEFKNGCQFCNEDIVMKSWVMDINQTREKLRSLSLHLTKKHEVGRKKSVMLLVGDLTLNEQEFLELSLERYLFNIGGYPFTDVCRAFCVKKFYLER